MRSIQADDKRLELLPWRDVVIDVQGPFTKAEGGEQYVLSYHCTCLKVPKLVAFKALQVGHFSRALVAAVMASRQIPDVVRSDRGPEMRNRVMEEFFAICNVTRILGASLTPRHQGLVERGHQVMMHNHLILMQVVCKAFPQEWPSLICVLEFLYDTAPQGVHGLSAHDMSTGYAIASPQSRRLAPFMVPRGLAETDVAVRLFANFRELYGIFSRANREQAQKVQVAINRKRHDRSLAAGETVYRRLPPAARRNKHLLPEPSQGPYHVVRQPTTSSVVLMDPLTGARVNNGASIPLDQILVGPPRSPLEFEAESGVRGIGAMLNREGIELSLIHI